MALPSNCDCQWHEFSDFLPEKLRQKLMHFQRDGVRYAIGKSGRCLLADEMGLGKTLQAICIAYYYKAEWPLLIVVPSSMKYIWIEEIEKWFPEIMPHDINLVLNTSDVSDIPHALITIVTYGLVRSAHSHVLIEALFNQNFKVVIMDESHYIKNTKTASCKVLMPLIQQAERRILITGTPALSRPVELYPQVESILPGQFGSWSNFTKRYCDAKMEWIGRIRKWRTDGASNLDELQYRLSNTLMIRRLKKDVLTQLPPKRRQRIPFELKDSKFKKDLDQAWNQLESVLDNLRMNVVDFLKAGVDGDIKQGNNISEMKGLVFELYRKTCKAKIGPVVEYVKLLLEDPSSKFLVFAHHHEMMDAIQKELVLGKVEYVRIDGNTMQSERARLVHAFQTKKNIRVAVLSILAAGVGLTFTAASLVVFAELHWTPGVLIQCEDRAHRIGQTNPVNIHYLVAKGSVDEWVWSGIQKKTVVVSTVLNGVCQKLEEVVVRDGDKVTCLANADVYTAPETSEEDVPQLFADQENDIPSTQTQITDFFRRCAENKPDPERQVAEASSPIPRALKTNNPGDIIVIDSDDSDADDFKTIAKKFVFISKKGLKKKGKTTAVDKDQGDASDSRVAGDAQKERGNKCGLKSAAANHMKSSLSIGQALGSSDSKEDGKISDSGDAGSPEDAGSDCFEFADGVDCYDYDEDSVDGHGNTSEKDVEESSLCSGSRPNTNEVGECVGCTSSNGAVPSPVEVSGMSTIKGNQEKELCLSQLWKEDKQEDKNEVSISESEEDMFKTDVDASDHDKPGKKASEGMNECSIQLGSSTSENEVSSRNLCDQNHCNSGETKRAIKGSDVFIGNLSREHSPSMFSSSSSDGDEIPSVPQVGRNEKWSCPKCTFLNHVDLPYCEMCETPKKAQVRISSKGSGKQRKNHSVSVPKFDPNLDYSDDEDFATHLPLTTQRFADLYVPYSENTTDDTDIEEKNSGDDCKTCVEESDQDCGEEDSRIEEIESGEEVVESSPPVEIETVISLPTHHEEIETVLSLPTDPVDRDGEKCSANSSPLDKKIPLTSRVGHMHETKGSPCLRKTSTSAAVTGLNLDPDLVGLGMKEKSALRNISRGSSPMNQKVLKRNVRSVSVEIDPDLVDGPEEFMDIEDSDSDRCGVAACSTAVGNDGNDADVSDDDDELPELVRSVKRSSQSGHEAAVKNVANHVVRKEINRAEGDVTDGALGRPKMRDGVGLREGAQSCNHRDLVDEEELKAVAEIFSPKSSFRSAKSVLLDWTCNKCGHRNDGDDDDCDECFHPKPSGVLPGVGSIDTPEPSAVLQKNLTSWKCNKCGIQNGADKDKCVACHTAGKVVDTPMASSSLGKAELEINTSPLPLKSKEGCSDSSVAGGEMSNSAHPREQSKADDMLGDLDAIFCRKTDPNQATWTCLQCGYDNVDDDDMCDECFLKRGEVPPQGSRLKQAVRKPCNKCEKRREGEERVINLDEMTVHDMFLFCCSKNTSRVFVYDMNVNPLNINFIPMDVETGNLDDLPDLLLHPQHFKLIKTFVKEWNSLTVTKRRIVLRQGTLFRSPLAFYEEIKGKKVIKSKQRYKTKVDVAVEAIAKADAVQGSLRIIERPKLSVAEARVKVNETVKRLHEVAKAKQRAARKTPKKKKPAEGARSSGKKRRSTGKKTPGKGSTGKKKKSGCEATPKKADSSLPGADAARRSLGNFDTGKVLGTLPRPMNVSAEAGKRKTDLHSTGTFSSVESPATKELSGNLATIATVDTRKRKPAEAAVSDNQSKKRRTGTDLSEEAALAGSSDDRSRLPIDVNGRIIFSDADQGVVQAMDKDGTPLCLHCHTPVKNRVLTDTTIKSKAAAWELRLCSRQCKEQYWLKTSNQYVRQSVFECERGVCQMCNFDAEDFFQRLKAVKDFSTRASLIQESPFNSLSADIKQRMVKNPKKGMFWHVDHITPVVDGGGQCDIDNLRTLCYLCHQVVTKQQNRERALERRNKKVGKCADLTKFFQLKTE